MNRILQFTLGALCAAIVSVHAADPKDTVNTNQTTAATVARKHPPLTEEQKALRKEMLAKYDANKDGKLSPEERKKISAEDKEKLSKAGLGPRKKKAQTN